MTDVEKLYQYADERGIDVDWYILNRAESLSAPLPDGSCAIAIDPTKLESSADELVKLAHELGHCETGAFYNQYATHDLMAKHERRADKWAICRLIPRAALEDAVKDGYTEPWQLAERFGVPEPFMQKAISFYQVGEVKAP